MVPTPISVEQPGGTRANGIMVGGIVGGVLLAAAIIGGVVWWMKRGDYHASASNSSRATIALGNLRDISVGETAAGVEETAPVMEHPVLGRETTEEIEE